MTPSTSHDTVVDLAAGMVRVRLAFGDWRRPEARQIARGFRDRRLSEIIGPSYHPGGIRRDSCGRPSWPAMPDLCWSNSACEGAAAMACREAACESGCDDRRVGVDIERIDPSIVDESLARVTMTPREFEAWTRDPRPELFFRAWTRKEAVLKCIGLGLHFDPSEVDVRAEPVPTELDGGNPCGWGRVVAAGRACMVRSVDAGPGFAAAVASDAVQPPRLGFDPA